MRQFVTLRFWATIVALIGLTGLIYVATKSEPVSDLVNAAAVAPTEHNIDLVTKVYAFGADPGFEMRNGRVTGGELQMIIDGARTMIVEPGTPGEITCNELAEIARCAVAADLLGDGVLWFSVFPAEQRPTITLPGIETLRDGNLALLTNGWVLSRSAVVELNCADDVGSLSEFVQRFGRDSTTTFNFDRQQIVRSTCNKAPETNSTTNPDETTTELGTIVLPADTLPSSSVPTGLPDTPVPDASVSGVG